MFAERLSFDIGELGFGSFQRPVKLPAFAFAGVNLVTVSVQLQNKFFVDRRLQRRRDFLVVLVAWKIARRAAMSKEETWRLNLRMLPRFGGGEKGCAWDRFLP